MSDAVCFCRAIRTISADGFIKCMKLLYNFLILFTKRLCFFPLGPQAVEAHSQKFEVKTPSGKLLFSADDNEVVVGAERLRVLGKILFPKSVF